jgi:hypothetical protein
MPLVPSPLPPAARRARRLAWAALLWERAAPLWTPVALAGLAVLALAAAGVLQPLPVPLHVARAGRRRAAAAWLTFRAARRFRLPTGEDARRRAEADSGMRHAPLASLDDEPAGGDGDLWALHRERAATAAAAARGRRPRAGLAAADPYALRFALPLLLFASLWMAEDAGQRRLQTAFRPDLKADLLPLTVEAWATPPPYTGRPPQPLPPGGGAVALPAGSEIALTVLGAASAPALDSVGGAGFSRSAPGVHVARLVVTRSGDLTIRRGGPLARWTVTALPDAPPSIAFAAPPLRGEGDRLTVVHHADDDHGVVEVRLRLRRGLRILERPLEAPATGGEPQATAVDLTATRFAGQTVRATLIAVDAAGQKARSASLRVAIPERVYTDPAALAVAEAARLLRRERRFYALKRRPPPDPETRAQARLMATLGPYYALHDAPPGVRAAAAGASRLLEDDGVPDPVAAAGLTWTLRKLAGAQNLRAARALAPELIAVAERIEQGPAGSAEAALRQAQRRLREAVARRAPPAEIARLLDEVRAAMAAYIAALQQASPPPGGSGGGGEVTSAELDALWRAVEDALARGETEKAMAMMDAIARLLASLQAGGAGQGEGSGPGGGSPLDPLQDRQRALGDETFGAAQGDDGRDPDALAREQAALAERTRRARTGARGEAGERLGEAAAAMAEAAEALDRYDLDEAVRAQRRAQGALAEGARAMDGGRAAGGLLDQALGEADPLGRRAGNAGLVGGEGVAATPDDPAASAREALDAIRARAADRGRPEAELRYLERLLERF